MTVPGKLPFDQINEKALKQYPGLLQEWLPSGKLVGGKEWVALNPTRADSHIKSFSVNIRTGKWGEFASGEFGGDPISLYAYLFCGGVEKRVEACRELVEKLGAEAEAPPKGRPNLKLVTKVEWTPEVPPPDSAPGADVTGWDHVFVYRDRGGKLLRYVVRRDAKGGKDKEIWPLTYGFLKNEKFPDGKTGWHFKHPDVPRSLYGLERLDGRPVFLVEGEKKADQVQALLPGYACLSLTGGTGGVNCNDLTPLSGMVVLYGPDNDEPGRKAAAIIPDKLVSLGATALVLDVSSHGFPDKWDIGNAVEDGWSAERIEAFLKDNAKPFIPETGDIDQEEPDDTEWKEEKGAEPDWWIKPLGHAHGFMYYLARRSWTVFALSHDQHTKNKLIGMAPMEYWNQTRFGANRKSIAWDEAMDDLIRRCEDQGSYKIDTVRGRGAWLDNGRTVLHLGGRLLVDGVPHGLDLPNSRHVYERRENISEQTATPLKSSEAGQLHKLIERFKWEDQDLSPRLMSGWIVCALVCGALDWRPAIWITGGSGAGKTTLLQDIVEEVLGGLVCKRSSASTEAGIRQGLDGDALAVLFDEAEAESVQDRHRMQGVFDLVRQSSKEGSAPIVKGTQTQTGAKSYTLRSSFLFSSINISMNKLADESRITVLGLVTTAKKDKAAMADYAVLRRDIKATLTTDFRAGLLARLVNLMPTINANARTFSRACADEMGSNRAGDQIGAMLAGYYALTSSQEITPEEAGKIVSKLNLNDANSAEAERDEQRLVNFLFQQLLTVKVGGSPYDRTIGELIQAAAGGDPNMDGKVACDVLLRHGIKFDGENGGVWIANKHAALEGFLKDTPWSVNWNRALKRLDGARPSAIGMYFGPDYQGSPPRAVFVPVKLQKDVL